MTKNTLLNIAIIICKFVKIVFVFLFIGLTTVFVHLQIDSNYYKGKEMNFNTKDYSYSSSSKWKVNSKSADKDIYTMDNIKTSSLYVMYFKYTALLVVLSLAIKEFQRVMKSVKKVKTFGENNVKSFRRIGTCIFLYFLLTSYMSISFKQGDFSVTLISFTPLILMLLAFIMAEVFNEGRLLKQENDLTI